MNFTLMSVSETHEDGKVSGIWWKDVCAVADLDEAIERAKGEEAVNSNKVDIAVVPYNAAPCVWDMFRCKRLDSRRIPELQSSAL